MIDFYYIEIHNTVEFKHWVKIFNDNGYYWRSVDADWMPDYVRLKGKCFLCIDDSCNPGITHTPTLNSKNMFPLSEHKIFRKLKLERILNEKL